MLRDFNHCQPVILNEAKDLVFRWKNPEEI
jgi:hypothetical protein